MANIGCGCLSLIAVCVLLGSFVSITGIDEKIKQRNTSRHDSSSSYSDRRATTTKAKQSTKPPQTKTEVTPVVPQTEAEPKEFVFIVNTSSKCLHISSSCYHVANANPENFSTIVIPENELSKYLEDGYDICDYCSENYPLHKE
ncbi:MAG: hypothetical protein V3G42_00140 [Oscillospiraceae bacterium]